MQTEQITPPRTAMEVFELLPEGTLCQVIENQLYMSPSPTFNHFWISRAIFRVLDAYVEKNKLGIVAYAPLDVYIDQQNVFQPDILFIANENRGIISEKGIIGTPDLVVEILSPGTEKQDLGKKKQCMSETA